MSKETNRKVIDTTPTSPEQQPLMPAFVRLADVRKKYQGDATTLILQRYLTTKIETDINRDEGLALAQALVEHFQIMPKEIAAGVVVKDEKETNRLFVVSGPQGCGKTKHAAKILARFGADQILEGDEFGAMETMRGLKGKNLVILTNRHGDALIDMCRWGDDAGFIVSHHYFQNVMTSIQQRCQHTWGRAPGKRYQTPEGELNAEDIMVCCECGAEKPL